MKPKSQYKIRLSDVVQQTLITHGEASYPQECCGFLYGKDGEIRQLRIARAVANAVAEDQQHRFEIDPRDYLKAEKYATASGMELLGIYHSHPNRPAIPSQHDLGKAVPYLSYLIVSVKEGKADHIRSWRLDHTGKAFDEESWHG
jgi:proteasome lid subunit RPN8/RPN11